MQAGRSGGAVAWKEIASSGSVASSGGGRRLWRKSQRVWRRSKARRQQVRSSGGGSKLWKRSKALWRTPEALKEIEGSGCSKHEALETAGGSGDGWRLWRRSKARRQQ